MKILLVDDDEIALIVAKKVLMSAGHEVFLADDGETALKILKKETIHTVITDWNMPRMTGIELCRNIRASSAMGYTHIIMVTTRDDKADEVGSYNAGADDYLTKPFDPEVLLAHMQVAERNIALESIKLVLFLLMRAAEAKDTDTGAHIERIRYYCKILAQQVLLDPIQRSQLPSYFPDLLFETSPLHDIGKIGVPELILLKPESLNDEEWVEMKKHAEKGGQIFDDALRSFPDTEFLRIARDISWGHHERWDGTGYPRGLTGEEIPISARIMAVADVYDAITMKRVYREAMTHDLARKAILTGKGSHFDPMVVDAFIACEQSFLEIKQKFPE